MIAVVLPVAVLLMAMLGACADSEVSGAGASSTISASADPTAATSAAATPTGNAATGNSTPGNGTSGNATSGNTATEAPEDLPSPSTGRAKGRTITIGGRLDRGVESGCVLLGQYLLLGGPRDILRAGATVSVTGRIVPSVVTTCQQGTPLQVERAVLTK